MYTGLHPVPYLSFPHMGSQQFDKKCQTITHIIIGMPMTTQVPVPEATCNKINRDVGGVESYSIQLRE